MAAEVTEIGRPAAGAKAPLRADRFRRAMLSGVANAEDQIPRVQEGVFFGAPVALPRGPHALPRDAVLAAQRERLMVAMTELMATQGYARVSVGAVASRSKISRTAFYDCFSDKETCAFAAYDRFIEVLIGAMVERAKKVNSMNELVDAMLDGYLGTLQQDPVVARAFQVEMDAVGPDARDRRRAALRGIAKYIADQHARYFAEDQTLAPPWPEDVYLAIVYSTRQLACDALDEHQTPTLLEIRTKIGDWLRLGYGAIDAETLRRKASAA